MRCGQMHLYQTHGVLGLQNTVMGQKKPSAEHGRQSVTRKKGATNRASEAAPDRIVMESLLGNRGCIRILSVGEWNGSAC